MDSARVPGAARRVPQKPFRAIYWATHFGNTYHVGNVEEMCEYVEDMGLLGYNMLLTWYDTEFFRSPEDPAAAEFLDRMFRYLEAARGVGMRVGLVDSVNLGLRWLSTGRITGDSPFRRWPVPTRDLPLEARRSGDDP